MVTGRPGIGKTTLAEVFLTEIEQNEVIAARIASANVESADLLRVVAYSYGIDVAGLDKATILLHLEQFFIRQTRSGKRVLLIIDEAQGLPHVALEELRLLADLQMNSHPLLQLFLVGQEKLRNLMREPDMEQFQQRVIGVCHLEPLGLKETRSYMDHRLRTAGWKGDPELTGAAVLSLYQYSKGVPRHVNKICTRLLLHGMLEEKHELDKEDVLTVAEELRAEQLAPMGCDDGERADTAELVPAELERDSQSVADLALRVDPQEAGEDAPPVEVTDLANEERATSGTPAPEHEASSKAARRAQIPEQRPDCGVAATDAPGWRHQPTRRGPSGVGEFSDQLRRRPGRARAAVSPGASDRRVRPRHRRRDYLGETARMFGRLGWKGKLGVFVGALLVVNVALAVLMMRFVEDSGDHKSFLVGYSESMQQSAGSDQQQTPIARTGDEKNSGNANGKTELGTHGDSAADTATRTATGQHTDSGQEKWFAAIEDTWDNDGIVASSRGRVPEQRHSASAAINHPPQESVQVKSATQVAAEESATETAAEQSDIRLERAGQVGEFNGSRMLATEVQDPPARAASSSPDTSNSSAAAQAAQAADPVDGANATAAPQVLAKATPSPTGEDDPPVLAEQKTVPPVASRQEKVAELLSSGQQSLKRDRLLIPTHDSAYKYFQQALILDPGNDEALFGIERIVARYIALARKALGRQEENKSRRYIDRGLSINPTDKRLLALRDRLNAPVAELEPEAEPPVVQAVEQTQVAEPEPQPENFFSRLKAFFTKAQSADKRNKVVVEER